MRVRPQLSDLKVALSSLRPSQAEGRVDGQALPRAWPGQEVHMEPEGESVGILPLPLGGS